MENTPEAAAPATEATNTNPAPAETPAASDLQGFTSDQLTEMKKFMDANGGFDKAFKTFKERISNPAPETPKAPEPVAQAAPQPAQPAQQPAQQMPSKEGYITPEESNMITYFERLAARPEYAPIAEELRNGGILDVLNRYHVKQTNELGWVNDKDITDFLSLYVKTIPAAPAKTPVESQAPTVDYIPTNQGKIDDVKQAMAIIAQSSDLKSKGMAEHPDVAAAKEFLKTAWGKKK